MRTRSTCSPQSRCSLHRPRSASSFFLFPKEALRDWIAASWIPVFISCALAQPHMIVVSSLGRSRIFRIISTFEKGSSLACAVETEGWKPCELCEPCKVGSSAAVFSASRANKLPPRLSAWSCDNVVYSRQTRPQVAFLLFRTCSSSVASCG